MVRIFEAPGCSIHRSHGEKGGMTSRGFYGETCTEVFNSRRTVEAGILPGLTLHCAESPSTTP